MKNVGNFFALARAQAMRASGVEDTDDQTLRQVAPRRLHPTRKSAICELLHASVPADRHLQFAAACHWFGGAQPELVLDLYQTPILMEARARMVDAGQVAAPDDAPCRAWAWSAVTRALAIRSSSTAGWRERMACLGRRVDGFIADVRHLMPDQEWAHISHDAALGLGWVGEDVGEPAGEEEGRLIIRSLLSQAHIHWFPPQVVDGWSVDAVVAWAEVCAKYVGAKRVRT